MILKQPLPREVVYPYAVEVEGTQESIVSVSDAKAWARVDGDLEDTIFDMLIDSAREAFERYTSKLTFIREVTANYKADEFENALWLPYLPVVEVISVTKDGEPIDYTLRGYEIEVDNFGEIEVVYECGLFEETASNDVKMGCLKWISSNYDDREDLTAMGVQRMPNGSKSHWNRYKTLRT